MKKKILLLFFTLTSLFLFSQDNVNESNYMSNQVAFTSSSLPIVIINTNGQEIPDDPRIVADMGIIYNGPGNINYITDPYNNYNGKISIELRGKSSQSFPKKSYGLETQDTLGENNNVSLLGMPVENDWILYAPYSDKSMLRNVITFELGQILDPYCSRTAYCELVVNDDYKGVYVLMEKIKKDEERVNIATLNSHEISGDHLTGGYIFKVDKLDDYVDGWTSGASLLYNDASPITFQYYYPKPENIVQQQRSYLENYVNEAENNLAAYNFDDPDIGYNKYFNIGSFVDFLILNEIAKEVDSYRFSTFFYKKKASKGNEIYAGPAWDFNLGYGNVDYWPIYEYHHMLWAYEVVETPWMRIHWWKRMMEDHHFEDLLATRWWDLRANEFSDENIISKIDSITTYIDEAQQRNYVRWPIIGEYIWPNYYVGETYADEVSYFKDWILNRLNWMDNNIYGNTLNPSGEISVAPDNSNNLLLNLSDDYFNNSKLRTTYFSLESEPTGLTIDSVYWINSSQARIAISSSNPDLSASSVSSVIVDDNILNGFNDIITNGISSVENIPLAREEWKVYISPETINLVCNTPEKLPDNIEIYNTIGQLVSTYRIEQIAHNSIPANLVSGIYFVRLFINGVPQSKPIIVK